MVIQVRGRTVEEFPSSLDEFFDAHTEIGVANMLLTAMEHVSMWREEVLFLRQRQQATSDYRENRKVRWMGECHRVGSEVADGENVKSKVSGR